MRWSAAVVSSEVKTELPRGTTTQPNYMQSEAHNMYRDKGILLSPIHSGNVYFSIVVVYNNIIFRFVC